MHYGLYIASAIGAVALYLMMPRPGYNPRMIGALLGAMTLGGLWLYLARSLPESLGIDRAAFAYYYVFSGLAIASAVRVITHPKPVYAALWFVMVVLATAGMFLLLNAEFMAFAMVIIYGGAILVTYLFVIMLASQDQGPDGQTDASGCDAVAYEPVAAVAVGFLLMAVLLSVVFEPAKPNPGMRGQSDRQIIATVLTDRPANRLAKQMGVHKSESLPLEMISPNQLTNSEHVGLDLFRSHPLGLELAGVILLVSLVGAVVIARMRVDAEVDPHAAAPT
jgi:NADH-quinone oxidoreductase subunit J